MGDCTKPIDDSELTEICKLKDKCVNIACFHRMRHAESASCHLLFCMEPNKNLHLLDACHLGGIY